MQQPVVSIHFASVVTPVEIPPPKNWGIGGTGTARVEKCRGNTQIVVFPQ